MITWKEFTDAGNLCMLATLRSDGYPRISPIEPPGQRRGREAVGRGARCPGPARQHRWAEALFAETGFDLRGEKFDPFYAADITGASTVEVADGHLDVTIWNPGQPERVVRTH